MALLPLFLLASLMFVLAACGGAGTPPLAGATPSASATTTQTSTATPASGNIPTATVASKPTVPLTALRMVDSSNGWALTTTSILRTTDGGTHWKDVTPANAGINQFTKGQFMNAQYAWVAVGPANEEEGAGINVLRTTDGGQSWQSAKINDPRVSIVDVPHFLNAQEGWLEISSTPGAGSAGSDIWHSKDGGQTWTQLSSNKSSSGLSLGYVTGISFKDAQTGFAAGNGGAGAVSPNPLVAITHDGGKTWQTKSLPHPLGGYDVTMSNSAAPVIFGNVVILPVTISTTSESVLILYRSNDAGASWVQTSVAHIQSDNTYVLDTTHAWATDTKTGKFYSTTDGGNHWYATSNTAYNLKALSFTDANTGWGVTSNQLLHTTDGGKTWQQISYTIQ